MGFIWCACWSSARGGGCVIMPVMCREEMRMRKYIMII